MDLFARQLGMGYGRRKEMGLMITDLWIGPELFVPLSVVTTNLEGKHR